MLLKYLYDTRLAQASYLVGCEQTGEALVIDPAREVGPYLEAATAEDLSITQVTETHIHADFASGSRELAARSGAQIYLSAMGGPDWQYEYAEPVIALHDGDVWWLGNVRLEALHTPGHTPEHLAFMLTDTAGADQPMGIFSGDFVFVGDVGRPDLLEAAAGQLGSADLGARQQFASVQRIKALPDYLQLWPGHGAGSACGKALGAVPSTTLGYEKRFNPAFQLDDKQAFVDWLLESQPEVPHYFARMKRLNKTGPSLLAELEPPARLDSAALRSLLDHAAQVVDFRSLDDFAQGHLPGTLNIPASGDSFVSYAGWLVDYELPLYLIVADEASLERILQGLHSIGIDDIVSYALPDALAAPLETLEPISLAELAARLKEEDLFILDVRDTSEYKQEHIPDAHHIPLGLLRGHLAELPRERSIITHCASGHRSQIAASLLKKHGFQNVLNLQADQKDWAAEFVR